VPPSQALVLCRDAKIETRGEEERERTLPASRRERRETLLRLTSKTLLPFEQSIEVTAALARRVSFGCARGKVQIGWAVVGWTCFLWWWKFFRQKLEAWEAFSQRLHFGRCLWSLQPKPAPVESGPTPFFISTAVVQGSLSCTSWLWSRWFGITVHPAHLRQRQCATCKWPSSRRRCRRSISNRRPSYLRLSSPSTQPYLDI
jgi:hypothetical protein